MNTRRQSDRTDVGSWRRCFRPPLGALLFFAALCTALAAGLPPAGADTFTVTSNPLWTDTGITVTSQNPVTIHDASGSWTWGAPYLFGPDGDYQPQNEWDEWLPNGQHGQLIGFVGDNPYYVWQGDPGFFVIGTGTVNLCGATGHLWLGFNDDWASGATDDNYGSVTVQVTAPYSWSGFLPPINADGSSIFTRKKGSTIPVKFQLTGASAGRSGNPSFVAKLYYALVSGGVVGTDAEAISTSAADSGNTFRYDPTSQQYIFNLSTMQLPSTGTYQLKVDMGDGGCVPRTVLISLK